MVISVTLETVAGEAGNREDAAALDGARIAARLGLTRAEGEVLRVLASGASNREIGAELHISVETVKTHVQRILAKLGVSSRVKAALVARGPAASR